MNKKSGEPINIEFPFYYKSNNIYKPCNSISFGDGVQIFYDKNDAGRKIVWIEADQWVAESVDIRYTGKKISINEKAIIQNDLDCTDLDVCKLEFQNNIETFKTGVVFGRCNLIFKPDSKPKVFLETNGEVLINNY
jgi:hypothetical protein